jgi:hypothetical protein
VEALQRQIIVATSPLRRHPTFAARAAVSGTPSNTVARFLERYAASADFRTAIQPRVFVPVDAMSFANAHIRPSDDAPFKLLKRCLPHGLEYVVRSEWLGAVWCRVMSCVVSCSAVVLCCL